MSLRSIPRRRIDDRSAPSKCYIKIFVCYFQADDDPNLAPAAGDAGFHFDPSTNMPNEGYKF